MMQAIVYILIGVAVAAALVGSFIYLGGNERPEAPSGRPRKSGPKQDKTGDELLVREYGDQSLINMYMNTQDEAERAEIAAFVRAASGGPEGKQEALAKYALPVEEQTILVSKPPEPEPEATSAEAQEGADKEEAYLAQAKVGLEAILAESNIDIRRLFAGEAQDNGAADTAWAAPRQPTAEPGPALSAESVAEPNAEPIADPSVKPVLAAAAASGRDEDPEDHTNLADVIPAEVEIFRQPETKPAFTPGKERKECQYCGSPLLADDRFCMICGMPVKTEANESRPMQADQDASQPAARQTPKAAGGVAPAPAARTGNGAANAGGDFWSRDMSKEAAEAAREALQVAAAIPGPYQAVYVAEADAAAQGIADYGAVPVKPHKETPAGMGTARATALSEDILASVRELEAKLMAEMTAEITSLRRSYGDREDDAGDSTEKSKKE